ncbi:hypothetical protein CK203_003184 [Vitis vinifera]|uniref:Uncharacterized protein n=1 Tax=Vitis vinifera TaxID=29760 RepID=A0A438K6Y2_VITVI|nr:hypothetical protein CK203_099535 [Vitis vinifera]RVX16963.1 hypothetical protein CK203_003184 [Vitis vinifera]
MWYYATILYFCNYYQKDPRERAGLAASAIAKNPPPPPPSSTATIGHLATHFIQPPAPTSFYFVFPVSYPPAIIPKLGSNFGNLEP